MPVTQDRTDEELMEAYQSGEANAFAELYARYSPRVYAYLGRRVQNKAEHDDLFQAVFLKLHKSRHLYKSEFMFAPWLFTICRTSLLDFAKAKKREVSLESVSPEVFSTSDDSQAMLSLSHAVADLSIQQRKALEMRYKDGLGFSEIANRLSISSVNVRQIISRSLRKLRRKI